jgi:predicted signal transduction protein with EAL and GGDEF domain
MINPTAHKKTPAVPPAEVSETHIQLGYRVALFARIVNTVRQLVNRFPLVALYHELQAARSLVAAYDATAERRARQRRLLRGEKSSAGAKGGQR